MSWVIVFKTVHILSTIVCVIFLWFGFFKKQKMRTLLKPCEIGKVEMKIFRFSVIVMLFCTFVRFTALALGLEVY